MSKKKPLTAQERLAWLEKSIHDLEATYLSALAQDNFTAALKAKELQTKLLGMIEPLKAAPPRTLKDFSLEELASLLELTPQV